MAKTARKVARKNAEMPKGHVGIDYLAKGLGVKPASARVWLRKQKIKRSGKGYDWSKAEADRLIKKGKEAKIAA